MRLHEIETPKDGVQYIYEVYNPLGYVEFIISDDKDWWEKAEHSAVAYGTFSLPLHFGAAISTGGYWANVPPGIFSRSLAVRKFASDIYLAAAKHMYRWGRYASRVVLNPTAALVGSTYAQTQVWQSIGDPMTGATHYSGAGMMSGGSMPVISGDGGHHSTWFDIEGWWDSL